MRRRAVITWLGAGGLSGLWGCSSEAEGVEPGVGDPEGQDDGFSACSSGSMVEDAGSDVVEVVAFEGQEGRVFGQATGVGLDGRLYTDLSRLDSGALLTSNETFYIRTRRPDGIDPLQPWVLTLDGLVEAPARLSMRELSSRIEEQGTFTMECSGNFRQGGFGLMSTASFRGVSLASLVDVVKPTSAAWGVRVTGVDDHSSASAGGGSTAGASWVVSLDQLAETGAFLATHMNGEVLSDDHGFPLRLFNPGWYGCSCIKWVTDIAWVSADEPSTSQMIEFSSRTHQEGEPALARDYAAPEIQQSAMPIRVEKHTSASGVRYRVVGIVWGGKVPVSALELSVDGGQSFERVALCPPVQQNRTWSLWSHSWSPRRVGQYELVCRVVAPEVAMRRLDSAYYLRGVTVDEVAS